MNGILWNSRPAVVFPQEEQGLSLGLSTLRRTTGVGPDPEWGATPRPDATVWDTANAITRAGTVRPSDRTGETDGERHGEGLMPVDAVVLWPPVSSERPHRSCSAPTNHAVDALASHHAYGT